MDKTPQQTKTPKTKADGAPIRDELKRLADEIRLQLHLGGMEAKDAWDKLEPKLDHFEQEAERVTEELGRELRQLGTSLVEDLRKLRDRLPKRDT